MKSITDDDLTLLYYGEPEDPALASAVAASPELSARYEALSAELDRFAELAPPPRGDDYGEKMWRKISPRLESAPEQGAGSWADFLSVLRRPRLSLAGALSLTLVAFLAFWLGREGNRAGVAIPPEDMHAVAAATAVDAGRLLSSSVSDHLEQVNLMLTEFVNTPQDNGADGARATDMLVANRLYRQTAAARGDRQLAAFLDEIEPLLIELAYEAHRDSPTAKARMQREIRDGLLFRVRIMNRQLDDSSLST